MQTQLVGYNLKSVQTYLRRNVPEGTWDITTQIQPNSLICNETFARKFLGKNFGILTLAGSHTRNCVIGINPEHLFTLPYGSFLFKIYAKRVLSNSPPKHLHWTLVQSDVDARNALTHLLNSEFIAVDIETGPFGQIKCIGFASTEQAFVFPAPLAFPDAVDTLLDSDNPKCFHNGLFDCAHLIAHGFKIRSYYFDTFALMHSFCAELPRLSGANCPGLIEAPARRQRPGASRAPFRGELPRPH